MLLRIIFVHPKSWIIQGRLGRFGALKKPSHSNGEDVAEWALQVEMEEARSPKCREVHSPL